jgi:hypothetical protein
MSTPTPAKDALPSPTIHEATRIWDGLGTVGYGRELTTEEAAERRRDGQDIVVRGPNLDANRELARSVEALVGPPSRPQLPHKTIGSRALPHFHQLSRNPEGHSFYETAKVKAKKL